MEIDFENAKTFFVDYIRVARQKAIRDRAEDMRRLIEEAVECDLIMNDDLRRRMERLLSETPGRHP